MTINDLDDAGTQTFGALLRTYRARSGLSQELLAERAALSVNAIGSLERESRRAPYPRTIHRLADALDLSALERRKLDIAADRARVRRAASPAAADAPRPHNLPVMLSPFVERAEVDDLVRLVERHRFVTIAGPGGIGKTRSAVEAAQRVGSLQKWNVRFLGLQDLRDRHSIIGLLASILSVQAMANEDGFEAVLRALSRRSDRTLIVIDNCEHVLDIIAPIIEAILKASTETSVLATSRVPLAFAYENVYRLPSLRTPATAVRSLKEARTFPAIDLFVTRAMAADRRLIFSDKHISLIVDICNRLDGIPLAIELAASRLPALGLESLALRVGDLLGPAAYHDRPPRHRTMAAAIRWSYELLDDVERLLLRRLCVFVGRFTLRAAEQVTSDDSLPGTAVEVTLASLVNKSLVIMHEPENSKRYAVLDSIKVFTMQMSDAEDVTRTERRHSEWIARMADHVFANRQAIRVEEYLAEAENAKAAIQRLICGDKNDAIVAARIISGLRLVVSSTMSQDAVVRAATTLLERIDEDREPAMVLRLMWIVSLSETVGSDSRFQKLVSRALRLCDIVEDDDVRVATYNYFAVKLAGQGEFVTADGLLLRADGIIARGKTSPGVNASFLNSRAWIRSIEGELREAEDDLRRSIDISLRYGFEEERLNALITLAELECAAEQYEFSVAHCYEALCSAELRPDQRFIALANMTGYYLLQRNLAGAQKYGLEALDPSMVMYAKEAAIVVQHLGTVAALSKRPVIAARLLGYVDRWYQQAARARMVAELRSYEMLMSSLEEQLTPEEVTFHAGCGAALNLRNIISEVFASFPLPAESCANESSHRRRRFA